MATIKNISRTRKWGVRPLNISYVGEEWLVEIGEEYDLVQFSINEQKGSYYWYKSFNVPVDWEDEKVYAMISEYVKTITDKDVKDFNSFIETGEQWGWD